ncbi:hypothetical protein CC86DRAFT_457916 [Ophiobolus disseminans]|uniref:Uncharacterized protein n=1 Tax=Ophiobolus disseminans TaxID=1469910 RepID=A0A6A6ZRY6_9PLEO|nr:hypothetical protein CC86DRAFT_457916 [Ophiobolus disseminans]
MAPIRRYLRITKYSVLEVRVYLDRPADADAWLLKRGDPALPRVIQAVRPLVLPKLREENERGKGKGGARSKKKGVKDVVVEDDFEVSIFLTELSSRHSVLTKQKIFKDEARIQSNSGKLTNWLTTGTSDQPVLINDDATNPIVIRDEEDEESINLANIPEADNTRKSSRRSTRDTRRAESSGDDATSDGSDSDNSALFVPGGSAKRSKTDGESAKIDENENVQEFQDDKKKLALNTSYDGFSIYGRILCLVVKRRGVRTIGGVGAPASSQQMLENWVSTQAAADQLDDDE